MAKVAKLRICNTTVLLQLVRPEQGMRCILESVHHDYSRGCRIINAWHAEGTQWVLTGEDEPKVIIEDAIQPHTTASVSVMCNAVLLKHFRRCGMTEQLYVFSRQLFWPSLLSVLTDSTLNCCCAAFGWGTIELSGRCICCVLLVK